MPVWSLKYVAIGFKLLFVAGAIFVSAFSTLDSVRVEVRGLPTATKVSLLRYRTKEGKSSYELVESLRTTAAADLHIAEFSNVSYGVYKVEVESVKCVRLWGMNTGAAQTDFFADSRKRITRVVVQFDLGSCQTKVSYNSF